MSKAKKSVDFKYFGTAVRTQYGQMKNSELYSTDASRDEIWDAYLAAFPEGSNPIFRERTEHDCTCCKNFIRNIGSLVSIVNNEIVTVWDIPGVGYPYDEVAKTMRDFILSCNIVGIFRTSESEYGAEMTPELRDGETLRWNHFSGKTDFNHLLAKNELGPFKSNIESTHQVLSRGLTEITTQAIDEVLELIKEGSLYRGDEHKKAIKGFRALQKEYVKANNHKELFMWQNLNGPYARFRNSVIGTLLSDLSTGVPLEDAVKMFESKVAPENYKRPTALITTRMIKVALTKLDELGLRDSIERRHAVIGDLSVNNVLFVDNSVESLMKDSLETMLLEEVSQKPVSIKNPLDINLEDFIKNVLPKTKSMEALFDHSHINKLVSLTNSSNPGSSIFKWDNTLAWSYNGDLTDSSLKQRVKSAGGNVDAALRVSLGWYNYDDLDIHCMTPSGERISFRNKKDVLDIDMNAGGRRSRKAVENLQWKTLPENGVYQILVHNFSKRENIDNGFELEFACGNDVRQFHFKGPVKNNRLVQCFNMTIQKGKLVDITDINAELTSARSTQDIWGIQTGQLVPVDVVALSPNYWDNELGNKHTFFLLKECRNPDPVRGIYNEYLNSDMHDHRKVLEVLASKTKAPYQDDQLSGLGFSSTQKASLTVLVKGDVNQAYNINF
jgi:hypothetical protein